MDGRPENTFFVYPICCSQSFGNLGVLDLHPQCFETDLGNSSHSELLQISNSQFLHFFIALSFPIPNLNSNYLNQIEPVFTMDEKLFYNMIIGWNSANMKIVRASKNSSNGSIHLSKLMVIIIVEKYF
jgi:hypothetical protein